MSGQRRRTPSGSAVHASEVLPQQVVVLDAQAISLLGEELHHPGRRRVATAIDVLAEHGYAPVLSVVTLVEQRRTWQAAQRLRHAQSRFTLVPVSVEIARLAAELLDQTGLDGHECVVDSIVVATARALAGGGPARVLSSDGSHMPKLCKASEVQLRLV